MEQLVISTDLFFPDGNVFLRAECTLFRVYFGLLAQHSPVFSDLSTLPRPPGLEDETWDRLPVITLQDSAADLLHFLKALHDWRCVVTRLGFETAH